MIVIGLIGSMAAGKSTATDYLAQKYGAARYRFSDLLRDLVRRLYLPETRDNLIQISIVLRKEFGQDLLARTLAEDIKKNKDNDYVIAEGIRREEDIKFLKELPGFHLISIDADIQTRYNRLKTRGENEDDTTKTFEEFVADHERETEKSIIPLLEKAEFKLNNNGDAASLYTQIDEIIKKL